MSFPELAVLFESLPLIEPYVRDAHILAIMFCLFLAALADSKAAKMFFEPLNPWDVETLEHYHLLLSFGLVILWATGIYLAFHATSGNLANISPKLMAKFAVVTILTTNAMMIGSFALPLMQRFEGVRLGDMPFAERSSMCVMSAISTMSWMSALALGAIGAFRQMPPEALLFIFGHVYTIAFFGGFFLASLAGVIAHHLPGPGSARNVQGPESFEKVAFE